MSINDNLPGTMTCPQCRRRIKLTVTEVRRNPKFKCSCGAEITVRGIESGAKSIDALEKALKNIGKK